MQYRRKMSLNSANEKIKNSRYLKLLDANNDYVLTFLTYIKLRFVKKSGQKLSTLSRIIPFVDFSFKKKTNDFFLSQFSYCQPVWMSHSD